MPIRLNPGNDYIDSTDYQILATKLQDLVQILIENRDKSYASRKLRFAEVDVEVERETGRLQPDEVYIPSHTIDTNIRREQPSYVQFVTQSPRAVIVTNKDDPSVDMSLLEKDLSDKLRYPGWQLPAYANIDGFQANGYGIKETVYDDDKPGDIAREFVQLGDFAFISDTRDLQACEMLVREYHYTKTRLYKLASEATPEQDRWSKEQVEKVIGADSKGKDAATADTGDSTNKQDCSLYRVQKVMFRKEGVVQVAWASINTADDWLRDPRPLYVGRREIEQEGMLQKALRSMTGAPPPSKPQFETDYPYFLYPYLISENDTITHLKGRVFLDQDVQEAISSLTSSTITQARRAAGLYGSKDVSDPNDDIMMQKNIFLRSGCILNSKVSFTQLAAPDPGMFSAIQMLVAGNANETSSVSFAASNRKDSRKTAQELKLSDQQQSTLSTVQVVLYSIALRQQSQYECDIIRSRVLAGIIKPNAKVLPLYSLNYSVKPSGDVDVIEKQQLIQLMMQCWEVIQNTACAGVFMTDLIEKLFPDNAAKYIAALNQAQQQQQSQQAQQMQQMMQVAKSMAASITELAKHPEMFSQTGKIHALPAIEAGAQQIEQMQQHIEEQQKQQQPKGQKK